MNAQVLTLVFAFLVVAYNSGKSQTAIGHDTAIQKGAASRVTDQQSSASPQSKAATAAAGSQLGEAASRRPYVEAITSYQQQSIDAHNKGDHRGEATAALKAARIADAEAATDRSQLPAAESAYRTAIAAAKESSQTKERSWAANNLAVLLMKSGNRQAALEAVSDIDVSSASPQERAIFSYNAARAYELNGDRQKAFEGYFDAYQSNPDFTQGALNGFRLLSTEKSPQVDDAVKLSNLLTANGHAALAHGPLLVLMRNWASSDSQPLLAALVRCYVAENLSPRIFEMSELGPLRSAVSGSSQLARAAAQISEAYIGKLSPVPHQETARFSLWNQQPWPSSTLAPLLRVAAQWLAENQQPEQALGRYMLAWNMTRDPKYALECASLLRVNADLDKDGRLLKGLLDSMFMEKGESYARNDWNSIFQMHVAIAAIFERNSVWGSSSYDVRGATFQWEHAIQAYQKIHANDSSVRPAPGLHAHVAICYARTGRAQDATRQFLMAAEGFVATGDVEQARANLELARSGASGLTADELIRFRRIEASLSGKS